MPQIGQDDTEQASDAWIPGYTEKAEQALKASERMYRELVENASDLIYAIDLQGNFTAINRAAQRISGYSKAEALKLNIAQLVASDHLEAARQMIQTALRGEPTITHDLEIVAKDGRRVTLEISHRLLLENGLPRGTHAIGRDITERRRLETLEHDRALALEMIATRKPLDQILTQLVEMVERQYPGMKAAASLLRDDRLYITAAPSLPKALVSGLDKVPRRPRGLFLRRRAAYCWGSAGLRGAHCYRSCMGRTSDPRSRKPIRFMLVGSDPGGKRTGAGHLRGLSTKAGPPGQGADFVVAERERYGCNCD